MSEPRNGYGFPFASSTELLAALSATGSALVGWKTKPATKLERAQAIAAEVRARKFPPVVRLTPMEKL